MRIIRATESIPVEHPVITLFGQPGICKTSLAYSAKDPLLLDFDMGAHRAANRKDTVAIDKWSDVEDLTDDPIRLSIYASIVVDTVGRCLDLMSADIVEKNPKLGRDGGLTLQGYGALKSRFRAWITKLRTLGLDVILIAHLKEDKDGDLVTMRPDITGASYGEVMKISDCVGYLSMNGKRRILDFNPTEKWVGKNPANWEPLPVPPIAKATQFLDGLIVDARRALGSISDASEAIAIQVDDWRAAIGTFTTPEEFNQQIPVIQSLAPIVSAQAGKLLKDGAAARGFVIKNHQFVAPVPAAALIESFI